MKLRRPIAVILSRFPSVTETFILREVAQLEREGQPVRLVPLLREDPPVVHPEARPWVRRAVYTPFFSLQILGSNLHALLRDPIRYGWVLVRLCVASIRSPRFLLGTLAIFPKSVHLARVLEHEGVHHVHAQFGSHPATAALIIGSFSRATYSVTLHAHDLFVSRYRPFLGLKLRRATFVRVISDFNRRTVASLFPDVPLDRVHVVHVGVPPEQYGGGAGAKETPVEPGREPWILTVAGLRDYKGIPVLIEACARLRAQGFPFRADIVGEGPQRAELERLIYEAELGEQVRLLGARDQHEVAGLLTRRPLFVLPSIILPNGWMEGIPVALMEAMAARSPVIASKLSGIPELVEHEHTGLLVEPGDAEGLARAIRRLAEDRAEALRLASNGRAKVQADFHLAKCTRALLVLLDQHNPPAPPLPSALADGLASTIHQAEAVGLEAAYEGADARVVQVLAAGEGAPLRLALKEHAHRPGQSAVPAARARHEYAVLERLAASANGTVPVPRPLALWEEHGLLAMEARSGVPLSGLLRRARWAGGGQAWLDALVATEAAGSSLRWLQDRTSGEGLEEDPLAAWGERVGSDLERARAVLGPGLHRRAAEALQGFMRRRPPRHTALEVVGRHGDYGPGNLLVDGSVVSVVDFEGFGPGLAGEDPAYFLLQSELFFDHPVLRRRFPAVREAFLSAYGRPEMLRDPWWPAFRLASGLQVLGQMAVSQRTGTAARLRVRRLRRVILEVLP